jgi:hypothetical protein
VKSISIPWCCIVRGPKKKKPAGIGGPAFSDEIRDVELRAQSCRSAQRAVVMVDVMAARGGEHLRSLG